jgi:hypothetical protein
MDQQQQEKPERMALNDLAAQILLKENSDSEGSGEGEDEADNSIAVGVDEERRRRAFDDEGNGIVMAPLLARALATRTRLAHREGKRFFTYCTHLIGTKKQIINALIKITL